MFEDHWGLSGRPFQLTPDPRFWFETATHRKAMAYLGYGLAQGEGFVVITGDIGAGKTTLVGHLLDHLDRQRLNPITVVSTAIEADDLLRIVAGQLDLPPDGLSKAELLVGIERGLHAVARTGRRTLLVVDEAQALPVSALEELRMLSNFQAGGHPLLQIILLGQPEFRDRLHGSDRLEQLRQRIIAIHHLDPMGEDEVADYIAHRLSVVGWEGRPDFTEDAFTVLYAGSGGVPRRLNLLAGRVMLYAAMEQLDLINGDTVRAVLRDLDADLPASNRTRTAVAPAPVVREPAEPSRPERDINVRLAELEQRIEAQNALLAEQRSNAVPDPRFEARLDALEGQLAKQQPASDPHALRRVAALERRMEEQDAALRRVLTLLVDWVEADETRAPFAATSYAPMVGASCWNDAA